MKRPDASKRPETVGQAHRDARHRFRAAALAGADRDARLLLSGALELDGAGLVLRALDPLDPEIAARIEDAIRRRLGGEPVGRIIGRRAFREHEFALSPGTLEPRSDTEVLVDLAERALAARTGAQAGCWIADLGTGSGAVAVSLLAICETLEALAIDLSLDALQTARRNAVAAGVSARFHPVQGDYLTAMGPGAPVLIVSNPPYIPTADIAGLDAEVREHDPHLALDGGPDGLNAYRDIAAQCAGRAAIVDVVVEIGAGQGAQVAALFVAAGFMLRETRTDLAGIMRAMWFRRGTPVEREENRGDIQI